MKWLVRGLVLGLLAAPTTAPRSEPAPAEFLPVRSPAYEEIEALAARGLLDSLAVFTRSLVRSDVARALLRSRRLHPDVERDLHCRRLERELARELADLDAAPAEPETGPLVDTGPREQRFRVSAAGHLRGDYDEKRDAAHYMRVTGTALSGQLSPADRKYPAAHRIEVAISPRLTLGLAEAVRCRSDNVDLIYASGLIPHAIVERIQIRDASSDSVRSLQRANVMASLDATWRATPAATLYGELLIGDLATENRDMPDRIAYQLGARSDRPWGARAVHLGAEYTRVYDFTYAVAYGQDFIHRDRPLGFALGPDTKNVWLTGALDLGEDWQVRASGDFTNHGAGRLGDAWTTAMGPVSNVGLSGVVERRREVWMDARFLPRDDGDVSAGFGRRTLRNEHNVAGRDVDAWLMRLALDLRY